MKTSGTYSIAKWDENAYDNISPEMKTAKASVEYMLSGNIEGKGIVEYLMFYKFYNEKDPHKSSAIYVGMFRFTGSIDGKDGSFVMEDRGTFENGEARSTLSIITGSGTGKLANIAGTGYYKGNQEGVIIELDYELQ
jgi:hypothetical protein